MNKSIILAGALIMLGLLGQPLVEAQIEKMKTVRCLNSMYDMTGVMTTDAEEFAILEVCGTIPWANL